MGDVSVPSTRSAVLVAWFPAPHLHRVHGVCCVEARSVSWGLCIGKYKGNEHLPEISQVQNLHKTLGVGSCYLQENREMQNSQPSIQGDAHRPVESRSEPRLSIESTHTVPPLSEGSPCDQPHPDQKDCIAGAEHSAEEKKALNCLSEAARVLRWKHRHQTKGCRQAVRRKPGREGNCEKERPIWNSVKILWKVAVC